MRKVTPLRYFFEHFSLSIVNIWKLKSEGGEYIGGELSLSLEGHQGKNCWTAGVEKKGEGMRIATGGADASIRVWHYFSDKEHSSFQVANPKVKKPPLPTTSANKVTNRKNRAKKMKSLQRLISVNLFEEHLYIATPLGVFRREIRDLLDKKEENWESAVEDVGGESTGEEKIVASCSQSWSNFLLIGDAQGNLNLYDTSTPVPHSGFSWKSSEGRIRNVFFSLQSQENCFQLMLKGERKKTETLIVFSFENPLSLKMWFVDFESKKAELHCCFKTRDLKSHMNTAIYNSQFGLILCGDDSGRLSIYKKPEEKCDENIEELIGLNPHKENVTDICVFKQEENEIHFYTSGSEGDIAEHVIKKTVDTFECSTLYVTKVCHTMGEVGKIIPLRRDLNSENVIEIVLFGFVGKWMYLWNASFNYLITSLNFGGVNKVHGMSFLHNKEKFLFRFAHSSRDNLGLHFSEWDLSTEETFPIVRKESHGMPINIVKFTEISPIFPSQFFLTSGEDGRLFLFDIKSEHSKLDFSTLSKHDSHKGSIRAFSFSESEAQFFLLSCDPFQTCLWRMEVEGKLFLVGSFIESKDEMSRVMAVSSWSFFDQKSSSFIHFLLMCKSDRTMTLHKIFHEKNKLKFSNVWKKQEAHKTTVLCLSKIFLQNSNEQLLFTGASDSSIHVWKVKNSLEDLEKKQEFHLLKQINSTSSAVNCIDAKLIAENSVLLACGGDDESIEIKLLGIHTDKQGVSDIQILSQVKEKSAARSAVKGVKICLQDKSIFLLCASADQRVYLWRSELVGNEIQLELVTSSFVEVENVESLDARTSEGKIEVVVIGNGIQTLILETK